ncbi:MarR family winged helix-turn-helix transcriptional regulator [Thermodesulfitimonas autotrophica]|uniref:MarR family winged helix-turn-helix transcriptional regulator n=1 Tax=Thermodesulfitimonas autotrophica TaxID=1894989 RepID=UPI002FE0F292
MTGFTKGAKVAALLREVNHLLRQEMRHLFRDAGFTFPQLSVIHVLRKRGRATVHEISAELKLKDSTVSGILDRLEGRGFVTRTRSEKDRRVVHVELTEKFAALHDDLHARVNEYMDAILSRAGEEELYKIVEGLTTLKRVLENNAVARGDTDGQND